MGAQGAPGEEGRQGREESRGSRLLGSASIGEGPGPIPPGAPNDSDTPPYNRLVGLRAPVPALVLLLAATASSIRAEDETPLPPVDTLLGSPLRSEREDGVRRLVAAGPAGLEAARGLLDARDPALRVGGWRALGQLGEAEDLDAALTALDLADEAEADAAARAAFQMAARLPLRRLPPLTEGTLSRRATRALLAPVADLLRNSTPDEVPTALLRLGGGIVPALVALAEAGDRGYRPRDEAVDALAALGGPDARLALVGVLHDPGGQPEPGRVLRALRHVARGPDLEPAQKFAVRMIVERGGGRGRGGTAIRQEAALFLQACPPSAPDAALRKALLAAVSSAGSRNSRVGTAVELARAFLALGNPTDADLALLAGLLTPPSTERTWVAIALEPWRDRPAVRRALEALDGRTDLPPAFDGWVQLILRNGSDAAHLTELACAAVEAPVSGDGPDARRLGLLLLARLPGEPPAGPVRLGLEDSDAWCRACALAMVERMPETGPVQALAQALTADRDLWVMAAAAELSCVTWDARLCDRLAGALLSGPRDLRARIVGLFARRRGLSVPAGLPESLAGATIDVRMRVAARLLAEAPGR
jgi:hypothetical protein